jgi:F-type H+-transporting ATPase subunit b
MTPAIAIFATTPLATASLAAAAEEGGFNPLDLSQASGLFWTCVIFLVALVPIWKMVMGPITKALEDRDEKAAAAVAAAAQSSRDAESARMAVESKLAEAQTEAAKLVDAARGRAEAVERQLKDEAAKQAAALVDRARSEIQSEQDKAIAAIRREVVDVSLSAAEKVLARKVDGSDDKRLVEELVAAAGRAGAADRGRGA